MILFDIKMKLHDIWFEITHPNSEHMIGVALVIAFTLSATLGMWIG